ncbi:hypothetical protein EJ06DRAFT_480218 [Trichodelitschia bisporula]|uniref:Histidine kinase n=1 Tax=Trichodelitschia bisporula TaxID=703511 RepID=A0A6G1HRT3_9PEZI|nr:hypothetical protein EJ06DRAFT_480218 [Trichodelitschia bisporula]
MESAVGVFECNLEGHLLRANDTWRELSDHRDCCFLDLVHPMDQPEAAGAWSRLVSGDAVTFETRWGERRVLSDCIPVMKDGRPMGVAGLSLDISALGDGQILQRTDSEQRALESERRFARFAEIAPVAMYIIDADRRMQYCNENFLELTGYPRDTWPEVDWNRLVYADDIPIVDSTWRTILAEKREHTAQFRLRRTWASGDGMDGHIWVQAQAHPELEADGTVRTVMGVLTDISQWKWAEGVQRERVEEALEAKRQQENFIDMTSHEMRNPLSAVLQCADSTLDSIVLMQQLGPDEKVLAELRSCHDALQTIVMCSLHQQRIIDDVLTLSKLDANLMVVTPVAVRPAKTVADAVHMFKTECANLDIMLEFDVDASLEAMGAEYVTLDPSRMMQVLINLISNAIKFTRGRRRRKISVLLGASRERPCAVWKDISFSNPASRDARGLYVWVRVEDTGCGLTPSQQGTLFGRFSQATPRTHIHYGGAGLGLFISKCLTELQGGAIGVQSQENIGSTFAFFVETQPADDDGESSSDDEPLTPSSRCSVLVVEDNLVNQKMLAGQLRKAGYEVHVAGHGEDALALLATSRIWRPAPPDPVAIDIVLMDVEMPVMDGLTCTRRIRDLEREGKLAMRMPILAVSANARGEQLRQARDAGMDDTITKPFRIPELRRKVSALVGE